MDYGPFINSVWLVLSWSKPFLWWARKGDFCYTKMKISIDNSSFPLVSLVLPDSIAGTPQQDCLWQPRTKFSDTANNTPTTRLYALSSCAIRAFPGCHLPSWSHGVASWAEKMSLTSAHPGTLAAWCQEIDLGPWSLGSRGHLLFHDRACRAWKAQGRSRAKSAAGPHCMPSGHYGREKQSRVLQWCLEPGYYQEPHGTQQKQQLLRLQGVLLVPPSFLHLWVQCHSWTGVTYITLSCVCPQAEDASASYAVGQNRVLFLHKIS